MHRPLTRPLRALAAAGLTATLALTASGPAGATAETSEKPRDTTAVVTPGDFTGYGFDQCLAPTQKAMNTWLKYSPFLSVGIYISGDSRACRDQPNLSKRWVSTQLRKGWRLLPITLGPQASCQPRFPRYDDDFKISPKPGKKGTYPRARKMGRAEATKAVAAAQDLGIAPGSTLWYDLEGYDNSNTHCRESALQFLSSWTKGLHKLDYVSGVYSSAGSGIKALDEARVNRPEAFTLPDMIWIARWDGIANTSTSYIRNDGWRPGGRVKQYQGGHNETWGGVTINIDRNYLEVGRGSYAPEEVYCDGVGLAFPEYPVLKFGQENLPEARVRALQCLLQQQGLYAGNLNGRYTKKTLAAANAWQVSKGWKASETWSQRQWVSLLVAGETPVLKIGSAGSAVRRLQRALNAASPGTVKALGVFNTATRDALLAYQKRVGAEQTGIAAPATWKMLKRGAK
ncbi:glycoside hydrolase domain-containing protein [Nocardioides ferulae]|uniref:glycoside hydrolase domain-containing protein n=1 Tax=Nocardioides ferulae TaxID=2340821 RepID=UPI000EACB9C8|nr:glycoside hydrolase domain-containing protein [Nocardioides ferulae]